MGDIRSERVVRMDAEMWALIAQMEAIKANVQAMKWANEERILNGYALAYGAQSFFEQSEIMQDISKKLSTQI